MFHYSLLCMRIASRKLVLFSPHNFYNYGSFTVAVSEVQNEIVDDHNAVLGMLQRRGESDWIQVFTRLRGVVVP